MNEMENIRLLRNAIREAGYYITSFFFSFNRIDTIVLFEDAKALGVEDEYVIAVLTFIRKSDTNKRIEVLANTRRFVIKNPTEFLMFFNISDGSKNPWDWNAFYNTFNPFVPTVYIEPLTDIEKNLQVLQLEKRDGSHDQHALYCYAIKRLPVDQRTGKQMYRSVFIDNKTRILYKELYSILHADKDKTITFCFSPNKDDYRTISELLIAFTKRSYTF